uniref:Uncharacterized protein n=1 Tax=Rhizophora mucronata TaxID=61149 RepID=A0A2P2MYN7_RHIMU
MRQYAIDLDEKTKTETIKQLNRSFSIIMFTYPISSNIHRMYVKVCGYLYAIAPKGKFAHMLKKKKRASLSVMVSLL